jgi:hypothetical protein
MQFRVYGSSGQEKETIIEFLNQVDSQSLSEEVANSMSWGDGDPIMLAIEILKKKVSEW